MAQRVVRGAGLGAGVIHLDFDRVPSMGTTSLKAITARKRKGAVSELPALSASVRNAQFEPERLATFQRLCLARPSESLPLTAPHVLAGPLHIAMLAHSSFPLPLLGLVHVDNRIVQHRPVPADAPLDIRCALGPLTSNDKGQRFELITEIRAGGDLLWEEASGLLKRGPRTPGPKKPRPDVLPGEEPGATRSVLWPVAKDMGRRYAGVSGDYNPIHLTAASARLFGFKRAIVHGMWSVARCLAELDEEIQRRSAKGALKLETSFKTPVFLPCHVAFSSRVEGDDLHFSLRSANGIKPHVTGSITSPPPR